MRIDPAVSDPSPATASPSATETAAPDDEPPGMRATTASAGLRGVPWCGLMPTPEKANSVMLVLPTIAAPASRSRATAAASCTAGGAPRRSTEPASVVRPATSYRSFTDTGSPASGGSGSPRASRSSAARAAASASSAKTAVKTCAAAARRPRRAHARSAPGGCPAGSATPAVRAMGGNMVGAICSACRVRRVPGSRTRQEGRQRQALGGCTFAGRGLDPTALRLSSSTPPAPRPASSWRRRTACGCCPCRTAGCRRRRSRRPCCAS